MSPPIVEARSIVKTYDTGAVRVEALRGVELTLERGEMAAIMGPSGCGKTTLLNCLSGLDAVDEGEVVIDGTSLSEMSDRERTDYRARHMGFVFQFYNLMPVLTAFENVELPLVLTSLSRAERRERVDLVLDMVRLTDRAAHYPSELSGGQQQRVAIARAIVGDPVLIVADEPTGDLDRVAAAEILGLMAQLNGKLGTTVLMVTHDAQAAKTARRLVHLEKGELISGEQ
jgi:putative ABC transport system ATP-binding protein